MATQRPHHRTHFISRNDSFVCANCKKAVPKAQRTYRNHCPLCLYSKHVDERVPGDRASLCHGLMKPLGVSKKGDTYIIIHECELCHKNIHNKTASDDDATALLNIFRAGA